MILKTHLYSLAIFLVFAGKIYSQTKIASIERVEETIATHDKANEPMFRSAEYAGSLNHTVALVMQGIQNKQLKAYSVSGDERIAKALTLDEWLAKLQLQRFNIKPWQKDIAYTVEADPQKTALCVYKGKTYTCLKSHSNKRPDLYLGRYWSLAIHNLVEAHGIALIRLDITKARMSDGSSIERVNYITFCDESQYAPQGVITPRFSVKWTDFIRFLEKYHGEKLYYSNGFGPWFRDHIFLTHNYYWLDYLGLQPFNFIPNLPMVLENITTNEKITVADLRSIYAKEGEGQISLDRNQGNVTGILIRVNVPNKQQEIYRLPWESYVKALKDSNALQRSKACSLADAWRGKWFVYDESIKLIYGGDQQQVDQEKMISRNGVFVRTNKKDALSKGRITSSFVKTVPTPKMYTYAFEEEVSLQDTVNKLLLAGTQPLQRLVREYVLAGKLPSIRCYDTLHKTLHSFTAAERLKQFYTTTSLKKMLVKEYPDYDVKDTYHKGDIVTHAGIYYKALKDPGNTEPSDTSMLIKKVWEKIKPETYDSEQLYILIAHHQMMYDPKSSRDRSELNYLEIVLPESENMKGVDKPILVVNWQRLRKLLLSDSRAYFTYKGEKGNYVDILEQRQYRGWLLKTGFLREKP